MSFHTGGMKANPRKRPPISSILPLTAISTAMLLAGCVPRPPAPAPAPRPVAIARPALPPAQPPAALDWRDAPITPGDWQWGATTTGSASVFAGGQFVMRCNLAQHSVTLLRAATGASGQGPLTITTSEGTRALAVTPTEGVLAVTLAARDPLLDAMAFSRGRFAVEAAGTSALYIPSWTEVSRVIEDCR